MIAAIVLCHRRPDLLSYLLSRCSPFLVSLHVDAKSPDGPALYEAATAARPDVCLLKRHVCRWAAFGHVAATIEGLRWFMSTPASHVALLTGQCIPIGPIDSIVTGIEGMGERSMVRARPLPIADWGREGGLDRFTRYHFHRPGKREPATLPFVRRPRPADLELYGGSSYWIMSREAAAYSLRYIDDHPGLIRSFRSTFCPDEMLFPSILMNSPLRDSVVSEAPHFLIWKPNARHPATIQAADVAAARASGRFFARKIEDLEVARMLAGP